MMVEYKTIEKNIERRSYLKGSFSAKYIGYLDPIKSDGSHENFYDLEIINGIIKCISFDLSISRWDEGESEDFQSIEKFLCKFPESLLLETNDNQGNLRRFEISLNEPKLLDFSLSNRVFENNRVFGDINGTISGYLTHYETEYVEIEVTKETIPLQKIRTYKKTGKFEEKGSYIRWEYYYSNGDTYWGKWQKNYTKHSSNAIFETIGTIFSIIILLLVLIPILIIGYKVIFGILAIVALLYFSSFVGSVLKNLYTGLVYFFSIIFIVFLTIGLISIFSNTIEGLSSTIENVEIKQNEQEITIDENTLDTLITNSIHWSDYESNNYSITYSIKKEDIRNSYDFRNSIPEQIATRQNYDKIVASIHQHDKLLLKSFYKALDSLIITNELDKFEKAELIVTLVQNIPYTLILPDKCAYYLYDDEFIRDYLSAGEDCEGDVKFGLFSPIEFLSNLKGDCDTRTLLLFTILSHYGYDVVMLNSELYQHSIIGINLPYRGSTKLINRKNYIVWETTAPGFRPGFIAREYSDIRFWNPSLISQ
jgi:hypothetical protein